MRIYLCFLFTMMVSVAFADSGVKSNPNQVMHSISSNTFSRINAEKERLQTQPSYIKVIIEEELIPYFDYKYAAYKVMGPHLKETTKAQRHAFVEAFKGYLVNAYGHILFEYDQQEIEVVENKYFQEKKIIAIDVNIRDQNDKLTQLVFKLRKNKKTGEWKAFDVIAEGISMLNTKQSEFGELMHKKGVDHVIGLLQKKNSEF